MHAQLDRTWHEVCRALRPGGFACINIGDATRTIGDNFALYPNHMRIQRYLVDAGLTALPCILWRKQSNAPNKFMGSGMLPAGAYVTLEHEYILIFRKGPKREFKTDAAKKNRRESALFWEERNTWFSDVWMDIKGTRQKLSEKEDRSRSAAYPFELAYRLINMYSVKGDTVLDPYMGTGTSMFAAIASGRHCLGYEIDPSLGNSINASLDMIAGYANEHALRRLGNHLEFVRDRIESGKPLKHQNRYHGFPVISRQEAEIKLTEVKSVDITDENSVEATHSSVPLDITGLAESVKALIGEGPVLGKQALSPGKEKQRKSKSRDKQRSLFDAD